MQEPIGPEVAPDLVEFAVRVAARAGRLAAEMFFAGVAGQRKPDGTEVTDADLAIEDLIRAELVRYAPDDAVLGEEYGESLGASGRRWVTDPISGTAYFTRRMPLFATLLAYEDEHGPAIGIVNLPVQRELIFAARGYGCWLLADTGTTTTGSRPLDGALRTRVGDRTRLDGALTLVANQHTLSEEVLVALHRRVALVGAVHHAAVHLVTGRVDAMVATNQGYDDLAPLPVILAEAGGRVTDLAGGEVLAGDGSLLASNVPLHEEFVRLVGGLPHTRGPKALT